MLATSPEAEETIGDPTKSTLAIITIPAVILTITEALTTTIASVDSTMALVVTETEDFTLVHPMGVSIQIQTLTGKVSRIARILSRLNQ